MTADKDKSLHWSLKNGIVLEGLKHLVTAKHGLLLAYLQQLYHDCHCPTILDHFMVMVLAYEVKPRR